MRSEKYKESWTVDRRKKMSIRVSGKNNPNYGNHLSVSAKESISKANQGKVTPGFSGHNHTSLSKKRIASASTNFWEQNPELKNKWSERFLGNKNPFFGKKHSLTVRKKLSDDAKKRIQHSICFRMTNIEQKIYGFLSKLCISFKHHYYFQNIKHAYQVDFYIEDLNLVIETDGVYWHSLPRLKRLDKIRNIELTDAGVNVVRMPSPAIKIMKIEQFKNILKEVSPYA